MRSLPLYYLLLLSAILGSEPIYAQPPKLKFRHISTEQGLSNSTIETIFQDSQGFMWFGTRDGLNRYDGYQAVVYRYDAKDSTSISDNYIRCLFEDRQHTLWIGTLNGLNSYNPKTGKFTRYTHVATNQGSLSNNKVTGICQDRQGNLWIGTSGGGLNRFQPETNTFIPFRHNSGEASISDDRVNCLFEDETGNLWVGTENGLNLFNKGNQTFSFYQSSLDSGKTKANDIIRVIQQDFQGNLWLGTEDKGILLFDPDSKTFIRYQHNEKEPSSLASNLVRSILIDKKGNCWVGAVNGGLNLFDAYNGSFYNYQNLPEKSSSLSQRTVSALFEDNQGNLWVGTHRGGVNLYTPDKEKFGLYRQEPDANSLSYNDVKAFCEDSKGYIWIGTDGGGLNKYDPRANSFQHYNYNPYDSKSIGSNEVLHIMEDKEENIWVSTWGGGLNLLDKATGKFTRFLWDPSNIHSISSNYVQKTFEDAQGNLWVATYYGGLNIFDRKTRQFTRVTSDPGHNTSLSGNNFVSICQDNSGNLWFGTDDGGLNCYNTKVRRFYHYFTNGEKMPDLRVLFIDSKQRLWVGQAGLYLFDPVKRSFSLYTDKAGLASEFIKGIEEDDGGNFWIATSNGLTQFNPDSRSYKKYNTADGLQGLEFEANAYMKTKSGQILFGGVNGYNAFYPKDIELNSFIPPVYVTDFQIFNKHIVPGENGSPLKNDISATTELKLSYKQSTFSFGFAALNYTVAENNQYAYRLRGLDKDWIYAGNERKAYYTNLAPATYFFEVKASNNDGIWNEKGRSIKIIITPPFWDTWWFKTFLVVSIVSGSIIVVSLKKRFDLRRLDEKKREEMHQVQLQFFTNISHEFRTPLSLILGPLEKLQKEDSSPIFKHYYKTMHRNANRMLGLINELMDFRKVESGALKLRVMPGNLDLFLQEIAEEFSGLASERFIHFTTSVPAELMETWFDRQVLEKIIINLISNSFKYTANNGKICVEVITTLENFKPAFENELVLNNEFRGSNYVYVRVVDNGIGISKESIAHLFERYYKITESHMGSGVGLAFVKSLTLLHKGDIFVYSEPNKGTEIIIGLPVSKADYTKEERWMNNDKTVVRIESIDYKYEPHLPFSHEQHSSTNAFKAVETKKYILIVDDHEELRNFLKESFEPQYEITEASDGHSGLLQAKKTFPDIIISDVMMPGMDGMEFCRRLKEDGETSHIPVIMLTAKDALESKLEGLESGADFYFSKPLSMDLLMLTIRNIFDQRQKLKERYSKDHYLEAKDLVHSTKDREFIDQLLTIIESQLTNPDLDVDYLCTQAGMSRTKLYQRIKSIMGQSIGEFVRTVRLRQAVRIMTEEDVLLTEVMYRVGIQTQSYFTKAFKKEYGKTPSQFLQELKK